MVLDMAEDSIRMALEAEDDMDHAEQDLDLAEEEDTDIVVEATEHLLDNLSR